MSEISSHSRVRSVRNAAPMASSGGWQTAASVILPLASLLGAAAAAVFREVLKAAPATQAATLEPLPMIHERALHLEQRLDGEVRQRGLALAEGAKVAALARLAISPLAVQPTLLRNAVDTMLHADTLVQVRAAAVEMQLQAEQSHHQAVMQNLVVACSRAAIKTGFGVVETGTGPQGMLRVIATNDHNQSLVTEISSDREGYPAMETEVIGVVDGTCHNILDAFDVALEAEGVRAQKPKRSSTGGICQLASAKKFVQGKMQRAQLPARTGQAGQQATRRARRLNDNRQTNRRK